VKFTQENNCKVGLEFFFQINREQFATPAPLFYFSLLGKKNNAIAQLETEIKLLNLQGSNRFLLSKCDNSFCY